MTETDARPAAIELFAGVGGFRLALERAGWRVAWSNQWEPGRRVQHASGCYVAHYGDTAHSCEDIAAVLDRVERGETALPEVDLVVGGFPCQDYSVAQRSARRRHGIRGEKGALWWEVHRLLALQRPARFLLENVDRLLKSPATQPGRDFAVVLASLAEIGYEVEWRVVNAADYGFPQRRRRVLLVGRRVRGPSDLTSSATRRPSSAAHGPLETLTERGVLARALPVRALGSEQPGRSSSSPFPALREGAIARPTTVLLPADPDDAFLSFGSPGSRSPFRGAGTMADGCVTTLDLAPLYDGPRVVLGDILEPPHEVPERYLLPESQLPTWRRLKGAKRMERVHRRTGTRYLYAEGAVRFPDPLDEPSRTIVTIEGGATPSRFTHVVATGDGRFRRLTPREMERLNGFPDDWTDTGMPEGRRRFVMGNALVVGLMERVGRELASRALSARERGNGTGTEAAATAVTVDR